VKKVFIIGVVIVLLAGLGWAATFLFPSAAGWTASESPSTAPATSTNPTQPDVSESSGREVPSGFAEYYNSQYHLSLLYPTTLKAVEHPEDGGGMTVTFEDIELKTVTGFQIFIVPFEGAQITDERFKEDDPSGVRDNLKNITVAGATGAEFDSTNALLGATHEVWFIHGLPGQGGYLYEVTTFKELGSWLDSIVQTWQFL